MAAGLERTGASAAHPATALGDAEQTTDHLRAGDLVAGTMVVKAPRRILPPDLARDGVADAGAFLFTDDQLDAYGVHELQVLETVLRSRDVELGFMGLIPQGVTATQLLYRSTDLGGSAQAAVTW